MAAPGTTLEQQRVQLLTHMPAVEVFQAECSPEQRDEYYPFTSTLYESMAFSKYRKQHFCDLILPSTMSEATTCEEGSARPLLLWDARFVCA